MDSTKDSSGRVIGIDETQMELDLEDFTRNGIVWTKNRVTVCFGSVLPQFRERTPWRWGQGSPFFPSTNFTRELAARRLFRAPPWRTGIYKHPRLLRDSNSSPTAQQSE
ncbi:hypothetical protein TNCV_2362271 [Trichonephila clavipes]|nr:hypothetical protein TNCV_2362271 [Trichonephila clavipes]